MVLNKHQKLARGMKTVLKNLDDFYEKITEQVCNLVREVGTFIQQERQNFSSERIEIKAKNDLVSYVDREAEQKLVTALKMIFPDAGFIVEENSENYQKELNWIIDPLDGTTNFIHGIPCYCISVALAREKEILVAVVLEVSRSEIFYSWQNGKSFLNDKIISVSNTAQLNDSLIATGFPVNNFERMQGYLKAVEYFVRNTHGVRRIGAAAADLCYVACGRLDAFFEFNLKPWDVAAGALIVQNAGGFVSDFSESNNWLFGKEIMVGTAAIKAEFGAIIQKSFF